MRFPPVGIAQRPTSVAEGCVASRYGVVGDHEAAAKLGIGAGSVRLGSANPNWL
jgi:hypothetical protein